MDTVGQSELLSTNRPGWLMVARGLQVKLWAMWILLSVPVVAGVVLSQAIDPTWIVAGILALALLVDSVGRILCFIGSGIRSSRLLISTSIQVGSILIAVIVGLSMQNELSIAAPIIVVILCAGQWVAASTFTGFLWQLTQHFTQPDLRERAMKLSGAVTGTTVTTGALLATSVIVVLVTVILAFVFLPFMFVLPYYFLLLPSLPVWLPVVVLWLSMVIRMFTNYGILIARLRSAILMAVKP